MDFGTATSEQRCGVERSLGSVLGIATPIPDWSDLREGPRTVG